MPNPFKARPRAKSVTEAAYRDILIGGDGCWEAQNAPKTDGYHETQFRGRRYLLHRLCWEVVYGPIPAGLVIDHLCRNPACVRLSHLEVVTNKENLARGLGPSAFHSKKTHCPQGHSYSGDNLMISKNKGRSGVARVCRTCNRERCRRKKLRAKLQP